MKVRCEYPRCGRSFKSIHARSVHQGKAHTITIGVKDDEWNDAGDRKRPRKARPPVEVHPALNGELGTLATIVGLYEDLSAASQRWLRERIAVGG